MLTTVRYFTRSGLVLMRGSGITSTFTVVKKKHINNYLDLMNYERVYAWQHDNACLVAHTRRRAPGVVRFMKSGFNFQKRAVHGKGKGTFPIYLP